MTKIDIFSGFLGAGKTTLIKKLIAEAYTGEQIVLIENEFGEIGIDGSFLQEAGINITEMNSGCICCSLVGDFGKALRQVLETYHPDRILIEPSGVGKLSDVIRAVQDLGIQEVVLNGFTTVVDAAKAKMYMKNFGEFFNNQVEHASAIILSRTAGMEQKKLDACVALLREKNPAAIIVTTPWDELNGKQLLAAMERRDTLAAALEELAEEQEHEHHHHHEDDCDCGCHEHEHHHHGDDCDCGCHDHEHHHADEVFTSWGRETAHPYEKSELSAALQALDTGDYGQVLRAKGIVAGTDGRWLHFDYVPGEVEVRNGPAGVTGRLCVIGAELKEEALASLFHLN